MDAVVRRKDRTVSPIWPTGGVVNIVLVTGASIVCVEAPAIPTPADTETRCAVPADVAEAALMTTALLPDTRILELVDAPRIAPSCTMERLNKSPPAMNMLSEIAL